MIVRIVAFCARVRGIFGYLRALRQEYSRTANAGRTIYGVCAPAQRSRCAHGAAVGFGEGRIERASGGGARVRLRNLVREYACVVGAAFVLAEVI